MYTPCNYVTISLQQLHMELVYFFEKLLGCSHIKIKVNCNVILFLNSWSSVQCCNNLHSKPLSTLAEEWEHEFLGTKQVKNNMSIMHKNPCKGQRESSNKWAKMKYLFLKYYDFHLDPETRYK